jgi:hypothetical protein
MNAQPKHPESGFGPTAQVTPEVTYSTIAAQVREMDTRALTPAGQEDVMTLIEYMRDEALKIHELNLVAATKLAEREAAVTKREREATVKARALEVAIKSQTIAQRLRGYFAR